MIVDRYVDVVSAVHQMQQVKALVVLASIYYPGDGIVAKNPP
jgi:hypothetical protein